MPMQARRFVASVVLVLAACTGHSSPSVAPVLACSRAFHSGVTAPNGCADLIVFMNSDASADKLDAVTRALRQDPDVASFKYHTKDDLWSEKQSISPDEPAVLGQTPKGDYPTSFEITLKAGANRSGVRDRYATLPGTYEAITP